MHPSHPFWSQEVPRVDGQLLLTPCPGTQQVALPLALGPRLHERLEQRAGTMSGGEQQMLAIGRDRKSVV